MLPDLFHPSDGGDIFYRFRQRNSADDIRRPSLEFVGVRSQRMSFDAHVLDSPSSADDRNESLDPFFFQIDGSDSRIRHHLVTREDEAIASDILHVDWEIRHGLRAVDQEERIVAELGSDFLHVVDLSGDVGDMSYGDDFDLIRIFSVEIFSVDFVLFVDIEEFDSEPFSLRQHLPWKDVRMMFPDTKKDHISFIQDISYDQRLGD